MGLHPWIYVFQPDYPPILHSFTLPPPPTYYSTAFNGFLMSSSYLDVMYWDIIHHVLFQVPLVPSNSPTIANMLSLYMCVCIQIYTNTHIYIHVCIGEYVYPSSTYEKTWSFVFLSPKGLLDCRQEKRHQEGFYNGSFPPLPRAAGLTMSASWFLMHILASPLLDLN
jgi:hypothetical protein